MNKLSGAGALTAISGIVLLMFKIIGNVTDNPFPVADTTLTDVLSADKLDQIDNLANGFVHTVATTVVTIPLYLHLIIAGVVLLIISGLISK